MTRTVRPFLVALAAIALFHLPASAQMVTGHSIPGFRAAFGLEERQPRDITLEELNSSPPANVLHPGDPAEFTFKLVNKSPAALSLEGRWDLIQYGTKSRPGDVWVPDLFKIADSDSTPVKIECAAGQAIEVKVKPAVPERFGGYALVLDLGPHGRLFGAPLVRVPAPAAGRVQFPTYAMDMPWPHEISPQTFKLFQRLGVTGCRHGIGYYPTTGPEFKQRWERIRRELREMQEHNIAVMVTLGEGGAPQPLGGSRPWLKDDGTMMENVKEDYAWLPEYDTDFEEFCQRLTTEFGWPKGPVNAIELWNEPWESVSISGWGADILRFREMYEHMARGIAAGRKAAGTEVLIGGACSSTNTRDKLFPDGTDKFLKWLDFVSIHYQPLAADPALEPAWMTRKSPFGPVRVWDTESWIANSEDRVGGVIASMRSMGQDRTAGVYGGNVYEMHWNKDLAGHDVSVVHPWAPAVAVAATQNFIGQRRFKEILFKRGLPWVYVFDGLRSSDDGTLVVLGDLGAIYDRDRTLFRGVRIQADATLTLPDAGGQFVLYDFYGNPRPATAGQIGVPLNGLGYFLRTTGTAGSFVRLVQAVRVARIAGYDPVDLTVADFTTPISRQPVLRVTVRNVLNRPVRGTLRVSSGELALTPAGQSLTLAPHSVKELHVAVGPARAREDNSYATRIEFDAGADGRSEHRETLHVNLIARRTIKVDGLLDDWQGVSPQPVGGEGIGASLTEKAYLPFNQFDAGVKNGAAVGYVAADDKIFYFAAKIADSTPWEGGPRFETRDDDSFFYPDKVFSKPSDGRKELTWPAGVRHFTYRRDFEIPSGNGNADNVQLAFNVLPPAQKGRYLFPAGTMPHYMAYPDTDYEFALNPVAEKFGGGTEIWCLLKPGAPRKHFFPRQPKAKLDGGPVKDGRLVIRRDGNTRLVECALPWSAIPEVKQRRDAGQPVKFSFRVNDNRGPAYELAAQRSVSKDNPFAFHNDWQTHWANELEFGFEK